MKGNKVQIQYNFETNHPFNAVIAHVVQWGLVELGIEEKDWAIYLSTFFDEETDIGGGCGRFKWWKPKSVWVEINLDHDVPLLTRTVLHELVHVRQYCLGELRLTFRGWHWRNALYSYKTKYEEHPWEEEACMLGELLAAKYNEEYLYA